MYVQVYASEFGTYRFGGGWITSGDLYVGRAAAARVCTSSPFRTPQPQAGARCVGLFLIVYPTLLGCADGGAAQAAAAEGRPTGKPTSRP